MNLRRLLGGVLTLFGVSTLISAQFNTRSLDAEVIGQALGQGTFGRTFTLPSGDVMKIVRLSGDDLHPALRKENRRQADFIEEYIKNTNARVWDEASSLVTFKHFVRGRVGAKLKSLVESEPITGKKYPLDRGDEVAMWVMEPLKGVGRGTEQKSEDLKDSLNDWADKNGVRGRFYDVVPDNWGYDGRNSAKVFDFILSEM